MSQHQITVSNTNEIERLCKRCSKRSQAKYVQFRKEGYYFVDDAELNNRTLEDYDEMVLVDKRLHECSSLAELSECFDVLKRTLSRKKLEAARGWFNKYKERYQFHPGEPVLFIGGRISPSTKHQY